MIDDLTSFLDHHATLLELPPESDAFKLKQAVMDAVGKRLTPGELKIAKKVVSLRESHRRLRHAGATYRKTVQDLEQQILRLDAHAREAMLSAQERIDRLTAELESARQKLRQAEAQRDELETFRSLNEQSNTEARTALRHEKAHTSDLEAAVRGLEEANARLQRRVKDLEQARDEALADAAERRWSLTP